MRRCFFLPVLLSFGILLPLSHGEIPDAKAIAIEIDDLSIAPAKKETLDTNHLPKRLKELIGKRVSIRGYLYPSVFDDEGNTTSFAVSTETKGKDYSWSTYAFPMECIIMVRMKPKAALANPSKPATKARTSRNAT